MPAPQTPGKPLEGKPPSTTVRYGSPQPNPSPFPDADQDGLSDAYEGQHAMRPNDASDAGTDPDADGQNTLQEFRQGSDPWKSDNPAAQQQQPQPQPRPRKDTEGPNPNPGPEGY
ncbi:MAG: hypothetical protein SFW62_02870 [Alphaproteobacteria bacterium]|nr:hypothetical protein [Alphaproteobacteria bacterium]